MMLPTASLMLRAGPLELELSPSIGGSITRFTWVEGKRRIPLLRESHSDARTVLDQASFPLVPYVNRIRGGRFTFRGREVRIAANMAGDISPLHGQGWLGEWTVESASETEATLRFVHPTGEWPWSYEAMQHVTLDPAGFSLRLECRNTSDSPMPCGLGQHPYFPCGAETRLRTGVATAFEIDEHVLPVAEVPATGRFDLADRAVCGLGLDHGFGGWSGEALMTDPAWPAPLRLSSPEARFFQLYSPATGGIFVAEPVTHANAALNEPEERWAELGMRVLDPGEAMALDLRLELRA
ncbi:aldose 1-epimerase [Sphingomonas astaxanthinifaciens]|uniref:Aldose 1-epimerase n=1 Tax=Sphingomonas astaxanthinifaciens DSM 22298 TaxID=1123267 RepID=A0ABQ5Z645_9SPHN|nr:aldose 1-epimerase [Sphingomonas astaxanthinifaciens]GLR48173.1 aldose 1-epimerase [Sphingomonas astaxanthinifaciens DSM 22298]